jgi:hypothetical protein
MNAFTEIAQNIKRLAEGMHSSPVVEALIDNADGIARYAAAASEYDQAYASQLAGIDSFLSAGREQASEIEENDKPNRDSLASSQDELMRKIQSLCDADDARMAQEEKIPVDLERGYCESKEYQWNEKDEKEAAEWMRKR